MILQSTCLDWRRPVFLHSYGQNYHSRVLLCNSHDRISFSVLVVMIVALLAQMQYQPFTEPHINRLETQCILTIVLTQAFTLAWRHSWTRASSCKVTGNETLAALDTTCDRTPKNMIYGFAYTEARTRARSTASGCRTTGRRRAC